MVLAFRLYGDFHWPPRPDIEDLATKTIKGVVEIHFHEKDAPGIFRPILRWTPRDKYLPDTPLPDIHPSLFDFKVKEAVAWFDANETNDCAIWIDAGAYTADTDWVAFRGAFLLEQHRASNALEKEALDLRWPLVRSCRYVPGKTVLSGLDVGRRGGPRFCLNLHLPLPARRATLLSGSQTDPSAFPFTAVYEPGNGAFDKILQFTTLVGGWIEGDAVDTSPAPVSNTSFVFAGNKYPDDASLGTFGFSARGKPAQGSFAVYGGTQKYKAIDAKTFWPDNSRPFTQDMLGRYGFTIDPKSAEWPRLKAGDTTADLSLRFATNESDARKPAFIYRIAVSASGDDPKAADDIKKGINGLSLRLREEAGGWLNIAENLYVDCKLSWDISDRDIWNTDERRWSAKVELSLHWKNDIPTGDNFGGSPANGADLDIGLLRHAAHSFGEARNALKSVEGGQARSALPDLKADGKQSIRLALSGPMLDAGFLTDGIKDQPHSGLLTWGRPAASGAKGAFFVRPRLRLTLADLRNLIQNSDDTAGFTDNSLKLIASNQTFFNDSAAPSRLNLRLSRDDDWSDTQSESMADGEPFFASYVLEVMPPADARSGRLSSLRFDMAPGAGPLPTRPDDLTRTYLRAGGPGIRSGMGNGAPPISVPDGRIAASIHMVLAVNDVTPIGVDVSRMDRSGRPTPLLIRPEESDPADGVSGYRYWLSLKESIAPTADRLREADIYETAPETGAQSYVVLSEEPFSLFRYSHKPLGDRGDAGSASVATYSSDDRIWQYRKAADLYHYILPPQAVGESADKPRRLEIHDLAKTVEDGTPDAIRPFVTGKEDDLKRRAVEFRLTPSTEFWIRPSDVERGYFMPESASHEIFRQRGEYGMGAALSYLRGEFLYGLSVGIDVSRETSIARQARVAEIEALTGRITGPARDADAEPRLKARWNALSRAVARRPERLEVWARDPDSATDFTPARFADGVSFTLRGTALHRPPLARLEAPGDQDARPKIGGFKPNLADRSDPQRLDRSKPRTHPQGLSGGALWPVESSNLFNELLRRPETTSGVIESIALSPTGGDATQKAAFLGGIVTVISETRNGHVERQKVEVLGRIGAFWHRAKHVVVYERTVNPSAQFAPRHVEDPGRTRSRRPILRKVREYIELLEPERRYPDFSAAAPRCAGFLERVRFNSKIINVDSAWSTEVGDYGWKIPLWNLMSARERPQVYPMPDIAFVTTAEGDGNNPVVSQECIDTDNLFFFSEFRTTTSDTNQWLARLDIDYACMPPAQTIAKLTDPPKESTGPDKRRPSVTRILPGTRHFTWRLAPAAQKTAINAGRSGKPVYVGLDSVSFMRVSHQAEGRKPLAENVVAALQSAVGMPAEPDAIANLTYWNADGTGNGIPAAAQYSTAINELIDSLSKADVPSVKTALQSLGEQWINENLPGKIKSALPDIAKDAPPLLAKLKRLENPLNEVAKLCDKLKTDAIGMIRRKEMLISTALSDWVADIEHHFPKLPHPLPTKSQVIAELADRITAQLRPIFDDASDDIGSAGAGAEKARAILLSVEADIEAVFDRARQRVEQFSAGYDRGKPWSAERRKSFRAGLEASVSNIGADIAASVTEARQRFAVELSGVTQTIGGHLSKALTAIAKTGQIAADDIATVKGNIDRLLQDVTKVIDDLSAVAGTGKLDDAISGIAALTAKIQTTAGISEPLKTRAMDALQLLNDAAVNAKPIIASIRALTVELEALNDGSFGELGNTISDLTANVTSLVTELANKAAGLVDIAKAFVDAGFDEIATDMDLVWVEINADIAKLSMWLEHALLKVGEPVDFLVASTIEQISSVNETLIGDVREAHKAIDSILGDIQDALEAVRTTLGPNQLLQTVVRDKVVVPALQDLLAPLPEDLSAIDNALAAIRIRLAELSGKAAAILASLTVSALGSVDQVSAACSAIFEGVDEAGDYIKSVAADFTGYVSDQINGISAQYQPLIDSINAALDDLPAKAASLIGTVKAFDHSVRSLQNDLSRSFETARMYGDRVLDAVGRLDDPDPMAMPSNILKLYSAVSSAPELAALKADIDRIRSGFDDLSDIIDTTEANALFNRLGDELKALGLTLPFNQIGDRLIPPDLSNFNIGDIFGNFGGLNLKSLFEGYKMPAGMKDAIRITHDFDKAQARAWVQVDIDAPMPGRRTLFSLGVFQIDFVDMRMTGQVRLEASKDQDRVTQTGFGRIDTTIDVIAAGQSIVRFEKFALNFTREKGLEIEFDPKNIRLNPSFKFIQDFLSNLFPDEVGGLKIVKQDNIPVGVEHDFVIPPMTLNFGTSGVSNISIENHFKLVAFPDFMIANRFNLSTMERPFIFSIFIIGGTGYIQIDAEYRPFDSQLMVSVEAGAGGSAALAFAVGPFVGQVFITLSGVMTYRKMIGKPGGGLSLAVVVVIAGQVEVCGIVTVGINLVLRLSYRDNGQIDGQGSLSVSIRISRFFTLRARANVNYKLRGGKSETSVTSSVSGEVEKGNLDKRIEQAEQAVKKLQKASN
ncbi:hypothetical protein ASG42_02850 [Rhizobium sp. Leaf391]|uniref:methyl-accepting chemotaxis protein n=1 Tax=Rhizobium sp. Leaf391 TaxID=1736360 RepID=UPI00071441A0|nr:methyl-accepting chemotaxis protein [Rhizobium sp. Leaf391]KQT06540.1 hypothetical protein ASG42_02850 [Rhizobium sp. Leaf391]